MSTVAVTFAFATDAQSFVGSAGSAASTLSYDGAVGNPAGALKTVLAGSGKSDNNSWARTLTYVTMGLPSTAIITGITAASCQSKCTAFASGTGCTSGAATLVDGATTVTLSSQRAISATDAAFVTTNGVDSTGLSKAATNSVVVTIPNHLGTTGGGSGKGATLYQDQLTFTVTYTNTFVATVSGGATGGGSATTTKTKVCTPSGGATGGGAATVAKTKVYTPSGGATSGGSATTTKTKIYTPLGGATTAGAATTTKTKAYTPSGGATGGGAAATQFDAIPSITYTYNPSGGLSSGGAALLAKTKAYTGSGGATCAGASVTSKETVFRYTPSGGGVFGGTAIVARVRCVVGTGGLTLRPQSGTDFTRPPFHYPVTRTVPAPWRPKRRLIPRGN